MTSTDLECASPWGEAIAIVAATAPICQHCKKPFEPAARGSKQKFCSASCRKAFHNSHRKASQSVSSVSQASQPEAPQRLIGLPETHDETFAPKPAPKKKEFDWDDKDSVVLEEQLAIAVYIGERGHLVIRQRADWNETDDTVILIAPQNITEFVDKLTDVAGIPSLGAGS
jgi:hypothetical protein